MSLGEQGGKVASSAIEGFKGNPLCLALVLVFAMLAAYSYFKHRGDQELMQKRYEMLLEHCAGGKNDNLQNR